MIKLLASTLVAFLVGIAIAAPIMSSGKFQTDNSFESLEKRIGQLEKNLETEATQRLLLEKQIEHERDQRLALVDHISELSAHNDALTASIESRPPGDRDPMMDPGGYQAQISALVTAGFAAEEAEQIVQLEAEMHQKIMSSRFNGERLNPREMVLELNQTLRTELGDEKYELYLQSTGRPTSVEVREILPDSTGAQAGLQVGDKILSYDGERVFNIVDLQTATQTGTEGQSVLLEVERDGIPTTLVIPRGQIGMAAPGFGFRRGGFDN